jgi:uncharacterized membrane protein YqjE
MTADAGDDGGRGPRRASGLFASVRDVLATALAIVHTRLELLTTEIEEELHRVAEILLWTFVVIFFGGITVLMLAFVVVVAYWEEHRLLAASLTAGLFVLVTVVALLVVRAKARSRPKLLASTIDEIRRDREALQGTAREEP